MIKIIVMFGIFLLGLASRLEAAECSKNYFVEQYKSALTTLNKEGPNKAKPLFYTLANEGFAPAQRKMGEFLLQESHPETRTESLLWLRLAMLGGDELAAPIFREKAKPNKEEDQAALQSAQKWRAKDVECMQEFRQKLQNQENITLEKFADRMAVSPLYKEQLPRLMGEITEVMKLLYQQDNGFLPYLRAIDAIYIGHHDVHVQAVRIDGISVLNFDARILLGKPPNKETLAMYLRITKEAIRMVVHDTVEPPLQINIEYKGRKILAIGHNDAKEAIELIKKGIDLAETLPPDLRALASIVKNLYYEAPATGNSVNSSGTYIKNRDLIWFKRNPRNLPPREIAASLVANGVFAEYAVKGETDGINADRRADFQGQRARDILVGK